MARLSDKLALFSRQSSPIRMAEKPYAPAFYSHAERVIQDKVPNSAHPEQIKRTLLNSGVKPEEMKWSGLDDHLEKAAGQPVRKEDLLNTVRGNRIKIKEIVHGQSLRAADPKKAWIAAQNLQEAKERHLAASRNLNDLGNQKSRIKL